MPLSNYALNRIIIASAYSESPLDEEVLREIVAERNDDPDIIIERHQAIRDGRSRANAEEPDGWGVL